jgi:extracellular matrix protein 14
LLKWLRDSAVEVVFGKTSTRTKGSAPGAALESRYRNDVVVRFNVTNSEEEGALARAAGQMFLDVWAFTPDYVDVRLDKDDVAALLTLLPSSLQPSVLIPDVAAAVWATYPSAAAGKSRFESTMADAAKMRTSLDGVGNIFFQDYQTLAVSSAAIRSPSALLLTYPRSLRAGCAFWRPCSHPSQT